MSRPVAGLALAFALASIPPATTAAAAVPGPAAGSALSTAELRALYESVRTAVNTAPLPAYLAFTLENASRQAGTLHRERLKIVVREADGVAVVRTLRETDGSAGDETPHVVASPEFPSTLIYRVGDFPLADFGLRIAATRPGVFDAPGTPEPEPSGEPLRTLASVTVVDLPYRLTDLGADTIDGRLVYHVGLEPLRDPGHHVLRQMWIDPGTFLPVRYVADRFVNDVVPFEYFVTVDTAVVDGRLVNADATGHYEVRGERGDVLTGTSRWEIVEVGFPSAEPDWAFDASKLPDHAREMIPGL